MSSPVMDATSNPSASNPLADAEADGYSSSSDEEYLSASSVPHIAKGLNDSGEDADTSTYNTSISSHNISQESRGTDEEADEFKEIKIESEDGFRREADTEPPKKPAADESIEKAAKKKKSQALRKEIAAVQAIPRVKSLKKSMVKLKVVQNPSSCAWHLPMYDSQAFSSTKKDDSVKKRKREDPARFVLRMRSRFEDGQCQMDECVFEDVRGTQLSELVLRKFTLRKIMKSLCRQLWNPVLSGVLTNGRRRSLYESFTFEKKLRDRGASAALLGMVIEVLAMSYSLLDYVYIWFADGSEEPGLRLSQESLRVASNPPESKPVNQAITLQQHPIRSAPLPKLPLQTQATTHNTTIQQPISTQPKEETQQSSHNEADQTESTSSLFKPLHAQAFSQQYQPRPPSPQQMLVPTQNQQVMQPPVSQQPAFDSAIILAKIIHDDRMRSRLYSDPTLLFDICCSIGLERRQEDPKPAYPAPPSPAPAHDFHTSTQTLPEPAPILSLTPAPTAAPTATPTSTFTPTFTSVPASVPTPPPSSTTPLITTSSTTVPVISSAALLAITPALPTVPPAPSTIIQPAPSTISVHRPSSPPASATNPPIPMNANIFTQSNLIHNPPTAATITTQPIIPIYATPATLVTPMPTMLAAMPTTPSTPLTPSSAPPTPKMDSLTSPPKLTITLTPKAPILTTAATAANIPQSISRVPTTAADPAKKTRKRAAKTGGATPVTTRKYHKRTKGTPPSSPPANTSVTSKQAKGTPPTTPPREPSSASDSAEINVLIKQETEAGQDVSCNGTSKDENARADNTAQTNGNAECAPTIEYEVASIDLGSHEEEKITFVSLTNDVKRRRLHLTREAIMEQFPPEIAQHYLDEVTKFREGSGNSSYRSALNRKDLPV